MRLSEMSSSSRKAFKANMAHIRQSRPDRGVGVQVKVIVTFYNVLFLLGCGPNETLDGEVKFGDAFVCNEHLLC